MNVRRQIESQKFISDVTWQGVSQVLMSLTGLAVLPALTKSYSSEVYGIWAQITVTSSILSVILTLQFGVSMIRFLAAEEDRDKRRRAFGTMLWPILILICIAVALSFLLRNSLSVFIFADNEYAYFVPLAFLLASMESLFVFLLAYLRARQKIKRLAIIRLAFSITRMLVIVALAAVGYGFGWLIASLIALEALFVAMVFAMVVRDTGFPQLSFVGLKSYLAFSAPQIPSTALRWIVESSDRYFITHLLSITQTGIYTASYILGSLINFLQWPIGFVLYPTVSKLWEQNEMPRVKNYFQYSMKLLLTMAIPAAGGLYILSQPLLGLLTTSDYLVGGTLVLLVALGVIFEGVLNMNIYIIYLVKKTVWLPVISFGGAAINAGINIILIPRVGIMGAAISTIVSYFVMSAVVTLWAGRVIDYKLDFKFLSKVVLAAALMSGCLWFIEVSSIIGIILVVIGGVVIYGLALFLFRAFSQEDRRIIREALPGLMVAFKSE
jgi:O-antigen/teichoic acid export membrane protein